MASSLEIIATFQDQASAGLAKLTKNMEAAGKLSGQASLAMTALGRDGLAQVAAISPLAASGLALVLAELTRYRLAAAAAVPATRVLTDGMSGLGGSSVSAAASVGLAARALAVLPTVGRLGALGLAATAAAMVGLSLKAANTQEQLDNLSVQTGLSVEALQALGAIAKQNGGDLDQLVPAFGKLNAAIAEINKGNFTAEKSFDGFGVSLTDLVADGKSTAEIFTILAQKFVTMTDEQAKASAQVDAFGAKNRAIGATLQAVGTEGIEPLIERMRTLGVVSTKSAQDAARAVDTQVDAAKTKLSGFVTQLENLAVVGLVKLGTGFKNLAEGIRDSFSGVDRSLDALISKAETAAQKLEKKPKEFADVFKVPFDQLVDQARAPKAPPVQPAAPPPAAAPDTAADKVRQAVAKTQAEITKITGAAALERQQIEAQAADNVARVIEIGAARRIQAIEADRAAALKAAEEIAGGEQIKGAARAKANAEADAKILVSNAHLAAEQKRLAKEGQQALAQAVQARVQSESRLAAGRARRVGDELKAILIERDAAISAVEARLKADLEANEARLGGTADAAERRVELERSAEAEIQEIHEAADERFREAQHALLRAALDRINRVRAAEAATADAKSETALAFIDANARLRAVELERIGLVDAAERAMAEGALAAIGVQVQREVARAEAANKALEQERKTLAQIFQTTTNLEKQLDIYTRLSEITQETAQNEERRAQAIAQANAAAAEARASLEKPLPTEKLETFGVASAFGQQRRPGASTGGDNIASGTTLGFAGSASSFAATLDALRSGAISVHEVQHALEENLTRSSNAFGNNAAVMSGMARALTQFHAETAKAGATMEAFGQSAEAIAAAVNAAAERALDKDRALLSMEQLRLEEQELRLKQRGMSEEEISQRLARQRQQVERDSIAVRLREIALLLQQQEAQAALVATTTRLTGVLGEFETALLGGGGGGSEDAIRILDDRTRRGA